MLLFFSILLLSTNALVINNNVLDKAMLQQSETASNGTSTVPQQNSTTVPTTSNNTQVCDVCWDGSVPVIQGYYCAPCPEQTFTDKCDYGKSLCEAVAGTWLDTLCSCQFGQTIPTTNTTNSNSTESNSNSTETKQHQQIENFGALSGVSVIAGIFVFVFGQSQIYDDEPSEWSFYEFSWVLTTIGFVWFWLTNLGLWLGYQQYKSDTMLFVFELVVKYSLMSEMFIYALFGNLIVQIFRFYYSSMIEGHSQLKSLKKLDDWNDGYDDRCDDYESSDDCILFFVVDYIAGMVFFGLQVASQIILMKLKQPMLQGIRQRRQDLMNEILENPTNTTNSSNELPTL